MGVDKLMRLFCVVVTNDEQMIFSPDKFGKYREFIKLKVLLRYSLS